MKYTNNKHIISKTYPFKRLILIFGVCLGILTISSFDRWNSTNVQAIDPGVQESTREVSMNNSLEMKEKSNPSGHKTIMHHNFIASYLLQESSYERKNKKLEEQKNFFSHLKQLHKIILSRTLGAI